MKGVKTYSNADHHALETLATEAVSHPNFEAIHYSGHSILVIYSAPVTPASE